MGEHGCVMLVGDASRCAGDIGRILPEACALVVVPSLEAARAWFDDVLEGPPHGVRSLAGLEVDRRSRLATWDGRRLALTEHEFRILDRLAFEPGRAWTFEALYEAGWGCPYLGDTGPVHAAVKRLRRKLARARVQISIESVRGVGFRLTQRTRARVRHRPFRPSSDLPSGVI